MEGLVARPPNDGLHGFFSATFEILRADLERTAATALTFTGSLLACLDPYGRHESWFYNCALLHPGWRRIVDEPARTNVGSTGFGTDPTSVAAYDLPRPINRSTFANAAEESARITRLLQRRLDEGRRLP